MTFVDIRTYEFVAATSIFFLLCLHLGRILQPRIDRLLDRWWPQPNPRRYYANGLGLTVVVVAAGLLVGLVALDEEARDLLVAAASKIASSPTSNASTSLNQP
jgi:hypothetical protein